MYIYSEYRVVGKIHVLRSCNHIMDVLAQWKANPPKHPVCLKSSWLLHWAFGLLGRWAIWHLYCADLEST